MANLQSLPTRGGCGLGIQNTNVDPAALKKLQMGEEWGGQREYGYNNQKRVQFPNDVRL